LARRALAPVEHFLEIEAASGVLLLITAVVALLWANSPWRQSYAALWHTPIGLRVGPLAFERDLHFWINDGAMTIFFFVVGLEIRREMHHGELSEPRRAALPLAAAFGGMLIPACVYFAFNQGRLSAHGWGIPMATDIAFAVGVLALLGKRVPPALRILLLALAVIDDVGAIIVIAVFYSAGLALLGFAILVLGVIAILLMQALGARNPWAYVIPSIVAWGGTYAAGVHPTLAGVIVGMMTPVRAWLGPSRFIEMADASMSALRGQDNGDEQTMIPHLAHLNRARREAISPLERLQRALHGWVAFAIMPLFALANAGVPLGGASLGGDALWTFAGVSIGLVLGKPVGVVTFSWLASRLGLTVLPRGVSWPQVALVGAVAGVGFTMAIFIAQLAFARGALLETAKLGILVASGIAAVAAYALGRMVLPFQLSPVAACTEAEAESSTEC